MKRVYAALAAVVVIVAATAVHANPALRMCTAGDVATGELGDDGGLRGIVAAHRRFDIVPIVYRQAKLRTFGYLVSLLVGADGVPVCLGAAPDAYFSEPTLTPERQAYAVAIAGWRYEPFQFEGKPATVFVTERVPEELTPNRHVPMPTAVLSAEVVSISRGPCFGTCPIYTETVYGDGHVMYQGGGYVDVSGDYSYSVPKGEVAALIERLRARDLWSMNARYAANITDLPSTTLILSIGAQKKAILDYAGGLVGMPHAVTLSEADIDTVARSRDLVNLSMDGLKILQDAGFDFASQAGADLLYRVASSPTRHDEKVLLALLDLGAPTTGGPPPPTIIHIPMPGQKPLTIGPPSPSQSLLNAAVANHYEAVVNRLIAANAVATQKPADAKP